MSAPSILGARRASTFAFAALVCGAALFALGRRAEPPANAATPTVAAAQPPSAPNVAGEHAAALPPGHPPLPAGHPPIGGAQAGSPHGAMGAPGAIPAETPQASITWTAPARWQQVPHMSAMRIATYRMPHVAGDVEDPELSVTRAGGDTDANVARWIGQFDEAGRKSAKRSERTVAGLRVVIVELHGAYTGMGNPEPEPGFAMIGAIVETPGMPHFFKLTGPSKSVDAARAELDALLASIRTK